MPARIAASVIGTFRSYQLLLITQSQLRNSRSSAAESLASIATGTARSSDCALAKAFANAQSDDRAVPVALDARDSAALEREFRNWDCVINSSWYDLNVPITEAAIRAGIHYCDLGGLYHQTLRQLKLDKQAKEAGVTCVLGIGSTPGTMNVLGMYGASKLDRVHKVLLRSSGAVVSGGDPGKFVPPYAIRTILDEFSMDAPILNSSRIV